ncbi:MAG: hypothetical protein NT069_16040 [Planctomycetota bacterium]|nr:hypothetical protein [Planctomycetota bacterium]
MLLQSVMRRVIGAAMVLGAAVVVRGDIVIDEFAGPVAGVGAVDADPGLATVSTAANNVAGIPGAWRIVRANRVAGGTGAVKCFGHIGQLKYDQTDSSRGVGSVWWDGDSDDTFGDGGFPAVDLTEGGANKVLSLTKIDFKNAVKLTITVKTTTGTRTYEETLAGPPFLGFDKNIGFNAFTGTGSFTSVTAIRIAFDGSGDSGSRLSFDAVKAR